MTHEEQFDTVENWVNSMRPHWVRCEGNVHNDPKFWRDCIHKTPNETWAAVIEVYYWIATSHTHYDKIHPHLRADLHEVKVRLDNDQRITIPYNREGYNKPVFRSVMAIKDIVADITERPFATTLALPVKKKTKPTKAEVMEQWAKTQTMIESLFE